MQIVWTKTLNSGLTGISRAGANPGWCRLLFLTSSREMQGVCALLFFDGLFLFAVSPRRRPGWCAASCLCGRSVLALRPAPSSPCRLRAKSRRGRLVGFVENADWDRCCFRPWYRKRVWPDECGPAVFWGVRTSGVAGLIRPPGPAVYRRSWRQVLVALGGATPRYRAVKRDGSRQSRHGSRVRGCGRPPW